MSTREMAVAKVVRGYGSGNDVVDRGYNDEKIHE